METVLFSVRKSSENFGENAFELGFLVGYEDFRLAANETADVVVSFLHETLRIFLAYFHLHRKDFSGETERIWNTVCSKEMFENTDEGFLLTKCTEYIDCLHFYLSLSKRNESAAFGLELLAMFIERLFHCKTLDFRDTHRINIFQAIIIEQKDDLCLAFLRKMLAQCVVQEYLMFSPTQSTEWILESLYHLRDQIELIKILTTVPHRTDLRSLGRKKALIGIPAYTEVANVVKFFPEPFDLVLHIQRTMERDMMIDLSHLMGPAMRQVHIVGFQLTDRPCFQLRVSGGELEIWKDCGVSCGVSGDLQHCSNLTHLVFHCVHASFMLCPRQ